MRKAQGATGVWGDLLAYVCTPVLFGLASTCGYNTVLKASSTEKARYSPQRTHLVREKKY
jgi:hypothetical protein